MKTQQRMDWTLGASLLLVAGQGIGTALGGSFTNDFNNGLPAGTSLYGDAIVDSAGGINDSGVLKLTVAENNKEGSFILDDLDGGAAITGFTATFKAWIGGGNGADGMSFCFASDLADQAFDQEGEIGRAHV